MDVAEIRILQTGISVIAFLLLRMAIIRLIKRTVTQHLLHKTRAKIIKKILLLLLIFIVAIFNLTVWGVDQSELFTIMASILTVIGIALFAQWSHLSNITSGIIIFFNHSVKLDDTVSIIDKDYEVQGRISDISLFFVKLKTEEGEEISLPNNIFLQKMIKKRMKPETEKSQ